MLVILDGWGVAPTWRGNAISFSNPPAMQRLWREYPHTILHAYQPSRQTQRHHIGGSDISHAMIGAGRDVEPDLQEISAVIDRGLLTKNPVLRDAFAVAAGKHRPVHLIGLASDGGVHSELAHLYALLTFARELQITDVRLHCISDGRDTAPTQSLHDFSAIEAFCQELGVGRIVSVIGRSYAMDRDQHWDRTVAAYRLWIDGRGTAYRSWNQAVLAGHRQGLSDEFLPASRIGGRDQSVIEDGDVVILWNSRADRLRQMAAALVDPDALRPGFSRQAPLRKLAAVVSLVSPRLSPHLPIAVAFPPATLPTTLGEIVSGRNLRQLRVAESEKTAHVTYFFNGGREEPFPGEDRLIIPTPTVKDLRRAPASATPLVVKEILKVLPSKRYDVIILNIANVDLVSHTGDLFAAAQAVTVADRAIGELAKAVEKLGGRLLITADHGNAEQMIELGGDRRHRHSINPVPFILVDPNYRRDLVATATQAPVPGLADIVRSSASLRDIAPTILDLLGLPVPVVMTGQSLLSRLLNNQ